MKTTIFIWKKIFVKLQNEHAFTLVDMLFALMVFTMIIFLVSPAISMMKQSINLQNRLQTMEWDVFCSQIKKEIRMSTKVQVVDNRLLLTEDVGTVTFEKYENLLRRRVNNTGHEVLLQNVSEVTFTQMPSTINVFVKDLHQREYSANIYSFIAWNVTP